MTSYSVKDIAKAIGAKAVGAVDLSVSGVAEPQDATSGDLALVMKPAFAENLSKGSAQVAMLWPDADWQSFGLQAAILPDRGRYAMATVTELYDLGHGFHKGIHPSAVVSPEARLGADVSVGPLTVIEAGAVIGDGSVIGPQCYIGIDVNLGANAFLRDHVTLGARVKIGANFICQPGARIGGDGFSFVTPEKNQVEDARAELGQSSISARQSWARIHSIGSVTIGDDVEVGANTTIDRGTIRDTVIGRGTKLDNLVQVGHNVVVGEDCLLCGMVGIAGSSQIGNNVVLGGQTGVGDNLTIGDAVITGAGTMVLANVPKGRFMLGYPAMKMESQVEAYKGLRRLPRLFADVANLKKAVSKSADND
ncbi:UDP-3-O-(3-hydroxymyristoyl)glucosamine N-acyltransferase [Cognatishimia sp.]|uniref:UDP-3-O-(3-hydroxymyristoyl)glucosamine N-acyltransferase n=1 Tax=Cognatishimia sp. TaxID=2211648 RepID=UPI003514E45B